jgi:hypothetical protein
MTELCEAEAADEAAAMAPPLADEAGVWAAADEGAAEVEVMVTTGAAAAELGIRFDPAESRESNRMFQLT